jgi:hypothetical protein
MAAISKEKKEIKPYQHESEKLMMHQFEITHINSTKHVSSLLRPAICI